MPKYPAPSHRSCADSLTTGPEWREEWIPLGSIVRLEDLQVRQRLDPRAVHRYAERTTAGHLPPPIKVARVATSGGPVLYLVDGWHRMEAGALQHGGEFDNPGEVLALVADLSEADSRWEAAGANMDHGVPLKPSEYRAVLKAFIRAGKHKHKGGRLMSYREIGEAIGKPHTTIRNWILKDFPRLAAQLGGGEHGNSQAGQPDRNIEPLAEALCRQALEAAQGILQGATAMSPEGRHEVAQQLGSVLATLIALGTVEPVEEPF